ncbi:FeoB-associated Cys-rich membrane protein [Lachnospiraceae bacterium MD1]|jgi:hypothetical protein|uniref:FeoB-associated Cys-rich membrane protein n=1 Tax=Variimorphobacter saccharofermentans TaxID=2755051 RepID=A0A839JXD0_9FIRM|nr:FeoB-associated Cys-rich membrane protein [Variimorphobacter saccharofermentans]MBB2181944.1 FeoB-associated Cys-rich membrane protein [Variimorphobacter saccharofermentans]
MAEIIIVSLIVAYTGFVIYKKAKDRKEGKSCCGGCSSCPGEAKCNRERLLIKKSK